MKPVYCLSILMLLTWTCTLYAEEVHTLEPVIVTAERELSAEINQVVVDLETEGKSVVSTVPDALNKTSGIDIQTMSILTPKSSQVRIRGLDERRSLIMLDGRPLNGTGVMGGQFVDWSMLSTQDWKSVDVGKGAFSAKYGNTLGGTIDLVPVPLPEGVSGNAWTGYERYDTWSLGASVSGRLKDFGARVSAGYVSTDGNLRNSEAERADASADFYYFWGGDGEIKGSVRYTEGDFNLPVENQADLPGYDPSYPESLGTLLIGPGIQFPSGDKHGDGSYYNKKRTELDLGIQKNLAGFDFQVKVYFNDEYRKDYIYSYDEDRLVLEREATPDRSWGWLARFSRLFGAHHIGFGADGNYQGYGGSEYTFIQDGYFTKPITDGSDDWDATRWQGAYVDDDWSLLDSLNLYAGLRYDDYYGDRTVDQVKGYVNGKPAGFEVVDANFDEYAFLPKLALAYRPVDGLAFFGRFARATRFPDNPAFYWYYGGYRPEVDPNSDVVRKPLTYEDALQYEAGLRYTGIQGLSVALNYYNYQVDDYIRWIFGYAPSRLVYNIDQVDFQGVELDMEGRIWENWSAFFNATWEQTKKQGDVLDASNALSDELSELPEFKFNVGLKYQRPDGLLAKATLRWVDDREVPFLEAGSSAPDGTPVGSPVTLKTLDAFTVVDLSLKYPLWKGRSEGFVTAGVQNLFDENYEEEYGFPQPGQTFFITAEITY